MRGVGGRGQRGAGGGRAWERCEGCVPALCVLSLPSPPPPLPPPTPRAGRRPSAAGSQDRQRGEGAELRGQAAAQAVLVKVPASERGHQRRGLRGVGGRGRSAAGWGHGRCGGRVPSLHTTTPSPSQSSAGETGWGAKRTGWCRCRCHRKPSAYWSKWCPPRCRPRATAQAAVAGRGARRPCGHQVRGVRRGTSRPAPRASGSACSDSFRAARMVMRAGESTEAKGKPAQGSTSGKQRS